VSAFPVDGTWPTGTSKWEKRSIALDLPKWDASLCIQCNKCALVCPHAAIRTIVCDPKDAARAPEGTQVLTYKAKEQAGLSYVVQVAPDDCTGCSLCVEVCPAKDKGNPRHKSLDMVPADTIREAERPRWDWASALPPIERAKVHLDVKGSQLVEPLFEFSLACSGCGETPYLKLLTQLFGDRAVIANATGCSSIFGGNLPTTPWTKNAEGRGPAWSNSLFEDNAEFGLGMRLALDAHRERARLLLRSLGSEIGDTLASDLLEANVDDDAAIAVQRARVVALREKLARIDSPAARELSAVADHLVPKSVWIVGGDGWAYDIGYGGLDHVLASDANVNVLVLDTEVYSNTGGQQSKATPLGASAKFASAGKSVGKKDLGMLAMSYGHVYVARVAFGAKDKQTIDALREAESWHGPSLVIAYSHCIAHGYDMAHGLEQQRLAVESGVWPLYRFDPRRLAAGEPPLALDAAPPTTGRKTRVRDYMANEGRFRAVELTDPARHARLVARAEEEVERRLAIYQQLSAIHGPKPPEPTPAPSGEGGAR
jgi:pyruvate-ferredoxin/flavodoxin oxidoreductase